MMQELRIFISSPGDVATERARAREVIESLQRRYARDFLLKPVFWEDLPLQPDMSFQEGIDVVLSERGADIAIFILWSRLGSPLGTAIRRADGSLYRSGTEREFDMMMQARACSRERGEEPRPSILVYTRQDEVSFEEALRGKATHEKKQLIEQKELVESFITESFMDADSGTSIGAYFPFDRPTTFTQRLRVHLQDLLDRRVGERGGIVWDTAVKGSPFMGLEPYQPEHADVFYGREEEVLEARRAMRSQAGGGCAFLLVSGSSGSGKSSLARAGILPQIAACEIDEEVTGWKTMALSPTDLGADPIEGMVRLLTGILPALREGDGSLAVLADALRRDPGMAYDLRIRGALAAAPGKSGGRMRILLLVDQLEEMFTSPVWTAEVRKAFLEMLEAFARSGSIWVLATVRSDFYPEVQTEPALVRMKGAGGLMDALPAGPDALSRLIKEPARLAGLAFEERGGVSLADRILKDASAHTDVLPLVSFVLRELYERRTDQNVMTFGAYDDLGGVEGALARRAEETFLALEDSRKRTLDGMLRKLVTLGNNDSGENLMRVPAPMDSFSEDELGLVERFVAARLFTTGGGTGEAKPFVLVTHESLLRVWGRATQWAEQNRDFLRVRARVETRMREGSPLLAGDPLLATAEAYLASQAEGFSTEQREWIAGQVSHAAAAVRKTARRKRLALSALAALALCAVGGGMMAMKNRELAKLKDAEAEREKTRNAAFHLLHRAAKLSEDGRLPEALGLFAEAYSTFPDFSTRSALLQGLLEISPELETTFRGFPNGVGKLAFGKGAELLAADTRGGMWRITWDGASPGIAPISESGLPTARLLAVQRSGDEWSALQENGSRVSIDASGKRLEKAGQSDGGSWKMAATSSGRTAWVEEANPRRVSVAASGSTRTVDLADRISAHSMDAGGRLALGLEDGSVFLLEGSGEAQRIGEAGSSPVTGMAWSRHGQTQLAVGYADGALRLFMTGSSSEPAIMPRLPCRPVAMEWNPAEDSLAIAGSDGTLRILRRDEDGYRADSYGFHQGAVLALAWSEDGKRLATGGQDGAVALWRPGARQGPAERREFLDPVFSLAVSADGGSLAAGTSEGGVFVWSRDGSAQSPNRIPGGAVWSLAWDPKGGKLAAGSGDERVFLLEPGKAEPVAVLGDANNAAPDEAPVSRVRWSGDGGSVALASHSGNLLIYGAEDGKGRKVGRLGDPALGLDWCGKDGTLAAGSTRGEIFVWDKASGEARRIDHGKGHRESVGGLAWSPAGGRLASCGNDGTVRLWDVPGGDAPIATSAKVDSQLEEIVYSEGGDFLATAGSDGFVRVWKADDLEPFLAVEAHSAFAGAVAWRGEKLVSCSKDSTVLILDLSEAKWLARAREVAGEDASR